MNEKKIIPVSEKCQFSITVKETHITIREEIHWPGVMDAGAWHETPVALMIPVEVFPALLAALQTVHPQGSLATQEEKK